MFKPMAIFCLMCANTLTSEKVTPTYKTKSLNLSISGSVCHFLIYFHICYDCLESSYEVPCIGLCNGHILSIVDLSIRLVYRFDIKSLDPYICGSGFQGAVSK